MTASNHVITGVVLAANISEPAIAVPVALLSHILLDILPHWDYGGNIASKAFLHMLFVDMSTASGLLIFLMVSQPKNWPLMVLCGVIAASPDLLSLPRFVAAKLKKSYKSSLVEEFLSKIQWCERPWGIWVEIGWFTTFSIILAYTV